MKSKHSSIKKPAERGSTLGGNLTFDSETFNHDDVVCDADMTTKMALSDGELRPYFGVGTIYAKSPRSKQGHPEWCKHAPCNCRKRQVALRP